MQAIQEEFEKVWRDAELSGYEYSSHADDETLRYGTTHSSIHFVFLASRIICCGLICSKQVSGLFTTLLY